MRRPYRAATLNDADLPREPLALFRSWLADAEAAGEPEPNAMALATVSPEGQPRVRYVLLKYVEQGGFVFFTNYGSLKGHDLAVTPRAALVFWWPQLERQVRVEGSVTRLDDAASDAYFALRPRGSQIGAWSSEQSTHIRNRAELSAAQAANEERFAGQVVPRPAGWGGYLVRPERLEFWQGREDRLHDRFEFALTDAQAWRIQRLAP